MLLCINAVRFDGRFSGAICHTLSSKCFRYDSAINSGRVSEQFYTFYPRVLVMTIVVDYWNSFNNILISWSRYDGIFLGTVLHNVIQKYFGDDNSSRFSEQF